MRRQVWVITGDKQETAINIAISCKLIRNPDSLLICNASSRDAAHARLRELQQQLRRSYAAVGGPKEGPPPDKGATTHTGSMSLERSHKLLSPERPACHSHNPPRAPVALPQRFLAGGCPQQAARLHSLHCHHAGRLADGAILNPLHVGELVIDGARCRTSWAPRWSRSWPAWARSAAASSSAAPRPPRRPPSCT